MISAFIKNKQNKTKYLHTTQGCTILLFFKHDYVCIKYVMIKIPCLTDELYTSTQNVECAA